MATCSSIDEPVLVFQFPEIDVLLILFIYLFICTKKNYEVNKHQKHIYRLETQSYCNGTKYMSGSNTVCPFLLLQPIVLSDNNDKPNVTYI